MLKTTVLAQQPI